MRKIVEEILCKNQVEDKLNLLLQAIPEIRYMIGFEHKHPHHHLDVWQHTLKVLRELDTKDIQLNMAALLHDIGKPFSYQDEEIRHFHGHAEVSCKMSKEILSRLGYDNEFIEKVSYLVFNHDTVIDTEALDNSMDMIQKRLKLQYADAKAHHPDKVAKRIGILDEISKQLNV